MKIYLDSCVLQDLKNADNKPLLDLILEDKKRNVYLFSHGHLADLTRDEQGYKFNDMDFIETIVDNNCIYYDKGIQHRYYTPKEYYDNYTWPSKQEAADYLNPGASFMQSFGPVMEATPIPLKDMMENEQVPPNLIPEMTDLLTQPNNLSEFTGALGSLTTSMMTDQKKFKNVLQYLHEEADKGTFNIFEGYDGVTVHDKKKFLASYTQHFYKEGRVNLLFDIFQDMYYGLEMFGIVKGSRRKQHLMNMANDAQHAFFGGWCDIVVSKDTDFLNKTKFMYDLHDLDTRVMSVEEFEFFLQQEQLTDETFECFLNLRQIPANIEPFENSVYEGMPVKTYWLPATLWSYFNTISVLENGSGALPIFSQKTANFSRGVVVKDIARITKLLVDQFGNDNYGLGEFSSDETIDPEWKGRTWIFKDGAVILNSTTKLFLIIHPAPDTSTE